MIRENSKDVVIEIISDFICPWCFIADTRLNKAQSLLDVNIERQWLPFELNPQIPEQGMDRKEFRTLKFGSWNRSLELDANVIASSKNDGIEFRHDLIKRAPNTNKAHRLTWLFSQEKKGTIAERIFKAYFLEGKDIGDTEILADLGAQVGMNKSKVVAFLNSEEGLNEVKAMQKKNTLLGIQGVPLITIGGEVINGAQPVDVFQSALQKAIEGKNRLD